MTNSSQPFRFTLWGIGVDSANVTLFSSPVAASELLAVETLTICDETSGATRAIVYAGRPGAEVAIDQTGTLTAGVPVRLSKTLYLSDGERAKIVFIGTTPADVLTVTFSGERRFALPIEALAEL